MAKFQSLIIGCVFICTLVVLNTLMCTAKVDFDCKLTSGNELEVPINETGKPKIVGSCYTSEACNALCSGRADTTGQTSDSKDGQCATDDEAPDGKDPMVCACCVYDSFEWN